MRALLFSAPLLLFLFTLQPIPAPHITTWDSISFKADALKQSYKGAKCCGNAAGCSVDVPLSTSTVNAPQHGLETHKFWENVNGLWEGELSYSRNSPDKAFPGDYKDYEGLIWRQARGDKYFQKNIFFYKHDPNWGVTEAMCRSNNSIALQSCVTNSEGIIGKKLDFGYGFFTCDGSAGAVKIFSEVHSKQSLDGVSLVPDASVQTSRSYCGDTDQFTAALEGGDTALAACGSTSTFDSATGQTFRYSHGQIIAINEGNGNTVDNEMYRAWLDTAGSHSYYKERRVATTLSSSADISKRATALIREKLKYAGFLSDTVQNKILHAITGASTSNLDNEITNWFSGAAGGNSLDVCSTSTQAKCL